VTAAGIVPLARRLQRLSYPAHIFADNPFDRGDEVRRDEDALKRLLHSNEARFLPFHGLKPLVHRNPEARLAWLDGGFLGDLPPEAGGPKFLGFDGERSPHFAVDVSVVDDPSGISSHASEEAEFEDGRAAATDISGPESGILAQARSQLNWHSQHRYCSACGEESQSRRGGLMRECRACGSQHFPRTDPVAIMLVHRGKECLLGQTRARATTTFYSCLAGFMDQGESIEEAVRREVREESHIEVGEVAYHSSQPWPFPASLMIGCHAEAITDQIVVDDGEMSDVRWFTRDEVLLALDGRLEGVTIPGPIAIAHHLIKAWATGESHVATR
jgi:NAD+ diphosphatase